MDVTERKEMEEALREADRRKDEFLAMLAHELRNPLAPIRTASEILLRAPADEAPAQLAVATIQRQVTLLTRLVDDLLDVSRITQGHIELQRHPIDLASAIAQAVETIEPQLREKQHRLSVVTATGHEPLYVNGDFARLVQCVGNVLSNAAKFTDPGGEISVRTRAESPAAVIEVADNGAGITPELLPRIFDLFVQSDRTLDRAQGGLGIGLAVVKRLVEMHGGEVAAESPGPGQGATFTIRLPRVARPQARSPEAAAFRASPRRVLVVDDNADAADSLAALLKLQGHETQAVYSGHEALERIESFRPHVALIDIGLPRMNGYELAQRLRARPDPAELRLVAITGYGQVEDRARAQAAGFDDHLVKPVDLRVLERAIAGIAPGGTEQDTLA
jgi:CheY-like chemotaxis protein